MVKTEMDIPAAPPLEGSHRLSAAVLSDDVERGGTHAALSDDVRRSGAQDEDAAAGRDDVLRAVQMALIKEIDASVSRVERARAGESAREHLEVLRSLLKAQVTAYVEHLVAHRATLFSHTSTMYADDLGSPGVLSTTLRGLLEGGTITGGQGAKLAQLLSDRRTLIIFGDRSTGKSTLLNSLFELVSLDDRFVAIERGPDLPALRERSFCVRLGVDAGTDIPTLFAKARRMDPGRLVIGEMHAREAREFLTFLAEDSRVGGLATLRAETVPRAVDAIAAAFEENDQAREMLARVKPIFVHMLSDETGRPRLAAMWSIEGMDGKELVLREVQTGPPATSQLAAET